MMMLASRGLRQSLLLFLNFVLITSAYTPLSDQSIERLPRAADFDIHTGSILAPILVPRVPGTPGSTQVLQHFIEFFEKVLPNWVISFQNSTARTPVHGNRDVPFINFIATRDPPGTRPGDVARLTLVAHYDSKYTPHGFIGAIDSAAPCAMIMHAARSIDAALSSKWNAMQAADYDADFEEQRGVQVIFLDGEEAFQSWTDTDSIYGARSLAEEWDQTLHPAMSVFKSYLNSIELFVLLDLLGSAEDTPIPSWQHSSHWSYVKMAEMEKRLRDRGLFKSKKGRTWLNDKDKKETDDFRSYVMQDDHIPFIARGVPVLHMIPARFPSVWHTINDDGAHLDIPTVEDWALLTTAFAAEYMDLDGHFTTQSQQAKRQEETISKTEL